MASSDQQDLFIQRDHAHLRIAAALAPQPRRPGGGGGGSSPRHNPAVHGAELRAQVVKLRNRFYQRTAVFGVNPENVLVIELNRPVEAEELEKAGLYLLSIASGRAIVAFAGDADMTSFVRRCLEYEQEPPPGQKAARHEGFFDKIDNLRRLTPRDVVDADLAAMVASCPSDELLRVDIECWCPDSPSESRRRHDETLDGLGVAGGFVIDASCRYEVGLSLIRADLPAGMVWDLASIDRVRRIGLLPRPLLTRPEVINIGIDDLPVVTRPRHDAPIVAVIDSGVRASHPLLAPAVAEILPVGPYFPDGSDESGHGTMVASLALHGSIEAHIHQRVKMLQPAGWLLGVRVLDRQGEFPEERVWEELLADAIRLAAERGARVINLSIGDAAHPYLPPGPTPSAAVIDKLAREHNLIVVISAGNIHPEIYESEESEITHSYPTRLLDREDTGLLPPAMSALALTVGALVPDSSQGTQPARESVDTRLMGKPGEPSPLTRVGPGIENMTKPEVVTPGGTYLYDLGTGRARADRATGTVIGAAGIPTDRLLATSLGTSFAAPLVAYAALRVLSRYPSLSANSVRALLLASTTAVDVPVDGEGNASQARARRRLAGYGRVDASHAEFSADHRAVLLSADELQVNQVHFYTVPLPDSFFHAGSKRIAVALAFDPEVRPSRLDYMASRMSVFAYRGAALEEVRVKYDRAFANEDPPEGLKSFQLNLQPSDASRLHGANQYASLDFSAKWDERYRHHDLVVVVRNTNRWAAEGTPQGYALAVVLETDERMAPLYSQLRNTLETLTEIESEIEAS